MKITEQKINIMLICPSAHILSVFSEVGFLFTHVLPEGILSNHMIKLREGSNAPFLNHIVYPI